MPEWIFGYLQVVKRSNIALGIDPQVVFLGFYKYLCLFFFFYNTNVFILYLFSEAKKSDISVKF